ncbi:polyprenyl synthetase family protein [Streptomyces sp. CAU 1734]|uniref:polyprenyl synthetase family protein n=1 Tax=Streptomyces sp. CAU 1734 TaxID=3140360 RepID=UPI0032617EB6
MLGTQVTQQAADARSRCSPTAAPGPGTDGDVTAAVERVLERVLRERVAEAARVDPDFARDVAQRLMDFVLRDGKRLRAGFLWWGRRAAGGPEDGPGAEAALRLGAALELIQGCALVHDDVMDESPLRRGAPAVHADFARRHESAGMRGSSRAFGTAAAVLTGDLALSWADDLMTAGALAAEEGPRVHREWQAMRTELVAGQYLDLHAQAARTTAVAGAVRIARLKSALYTVERPLALGAALAGADEATTSALRAAGRCAGIAFQLRDDILGAFGDPARTGKPSGDDLTEGKLTCLRALALQLARSSGDGDAVDALEGSGPPDPDRLRAAIERTGARAVVEDRIGRLVETGIGHLAPIRCEPRVLRDLGLLIRRAADVPAPDGGAA